KGKPVTADQAKQIAMQFVGVNEQEAEVKVEKTGKGHAYQAYSITIQNRGSKDEHVMNLDVTEKGGHVVWLLDNRNVKEAKLDLNQAKQRADEFLKAHDLHQMEAMVQEQYGNLAVISYVHTEDEVRIYRDLITLQVALDTGNVVGYQAEDYLLNHKADRQMAMPKLTKEEARKEVNPNLQVEQSRLAIVLNDENKETLCYEFMGRLDDQVYRVFINAQDGEEEAVEKLDGVGQTQS